MNSRKSYTTTIKKSDPKGPLNCFVYIVNLCLRVTDLGDSGFLLKYNSNDRLISEFPKPAGLLK